MKNFIILLGAIFFLSGCATYKFHHGKPPYDKGYVVSRDDYTIPEYTLGKDNSVPKIKLAKERFKRRRNTVEDYYKKMGFIQNHFVMCTWEPIITFLKIASGPFRLPFIAISDYRYEHNPKYKEKIKKQEAEQDLKEENRINALKVKLNAYVEKDLTREQPVIEDTKRETSVEAPPETPPEAPLKETQIAKSLAEAEATLVEENPPEIKPEPEPEPIPLEIPKEMPREETIVKPEPEPMPEPPLQEPVVEQKKETKPTKLPTAVIIAKPTKGLSPLRVRFYANKSYAPGNKIIAYSWDFGDGDTSTKMNPINIYYSGTFQPRYYTVTLTVHDNKGNTASASTTIEVLNK
ncbi:MAG: PKD domain-containing protein [Candidatus Omnitrophica bacterium]|nr:PKD domain-containing protein [Candidatus Omnitrophota bacterium]